MKNSKLLIFKMTILNFHNVKALCKIKKKKGYWGRRAGTPSASALNTSLWYQLYVHEGDTQIYLIAIGRQR